MRPRSRAVCTSSSSGCGANAPETTSASSRSSASSMPASSVSSSRPAVASARACAREPAMSCRASRQSNWVERDSSVRASAGPPEKRPPHRLRGPSVIAALEGCRPVEVDRVAELGVPGGGELGGHPEDLDEALGVGLVEGVPGVVGGEVEVVQARRAAPAGDHGAAAVHEQADVTGDVALGVLDEHVEGALERGEPLAVVDELAPTLVHALLEAGLLALEDRKSTRLNSSHVAITYAVICLKKKIT